MCAPLLGLVACVLSLLVSALTWSLALLLRGSPDGSDRVLGARIGAAALLWAACVSCASLALYVTSHEVLLAVLSSAVSLADLAAVALVARAIEAAARP